MVGGLFGRFSFCSTTCCPLFPFTAAATVLELVCGRRPLSRERVALLIVQPFPLREQHRRFVRHRCIIACFSARNEMGALLVRMVEDASLGTISCGTPRCCTKWHHSVCIPPSRTFANFPMLYSAYLMRRRKHVPSMTHTSAPLKEKDEMSRPPPTPPFTNKQTDKQNAQGSYVLVVVWHHRHATDRL